MNDHKPTLFNEWKLNERVKEHKLQPFKVKQIFFELYKNQNTEWNSLTTLSKDLRMQLQSDFDLLAIELIDTVEATDTTKFAFKTRDGNLIEAILMYHRQQENLVSKGIWHGKRWFLRSSLPIPISRKDSERKKMERITQSEM